MVKPEPTIKSLTAYDMIRNLILSGEALPGTRLVLAELEEKLGVGRGPIRDALMRLDKSGLVQNIPYKGAIVTPPPSFREMERIYQFRTVVEVSLALEASRNMNADDIAKLEALANTMAATPPDEPYFFHQDREFHSALYTCAKMPHLHAVVGHLLDCVEVFLNGRPYDPADVNLFVEQHATIIQALKDGDTVVLHQTLEQNILVGLELVRKQMHYFHPAARA